MQIPLVAGELTLTSTRRPTLIDVVTANVQMLSGWSCEHGFAMGGLMMRS